MIRRLPLGLFAASCCRTSLQWASAAVSSSSSRVGAVRGQSRLRAHVRSAATRSAVRGSWQARRVHRVLFRRQPILRLLKKRGALAKSPGDGLRRRGSAAARQRRRALRGFSSGRATSPKTPTSTSRLATMRGRSKRRRARLLKAAAVTPRATATVTLNSSADEDIASTCIASRSEELRETDARIAMRGLMSQYFRVEGRPVSEENLMRRRKAAELCKPLIERSEWKNANTLAQGLIDTSERYHKTGAGTSRGESRALPDRRLWNGPHVGLPEGDEAGPSSVTLEPPNWSNSMPGLPLAQVQRDHDEQFVSNDMAHSLQFGAAPDESDDLPDYGALDVDEDTAGSLGKRPDA